MATVKHALLSPAINAQPGIPNAEDEKQLFEEKFGQMAYQAFSSKFPDLVPNIVTFKILDSDLENGTGIGAFIIEQEGDYVYVPAIVSENELKPFDLMYVKSKDIFLPLSNEWLEEVAKGTINSLGEGVKLPDTVATDVDIRNIVVPPTTGRYSYASFEVSPRARMHATASEPLGRRLTKLAELGPFPGGGGTGAGGGENTFDPELWATFVEQFQRIQQMTPGQALDSNMADVETLSKMYKSHQKTWELMNTSGPAGAAVQQQAVQQGQPMQAPASPQGMPPAQQGMQVTASAKTANAPRTVGSKLDSLLVNIAKGGALGGGVGGIAAAADGDSSDVPSGIVHGAIGGLLAAPLGAIAGEDIAARHFPHTGAVKSRALGAGLGVAAGGYLGGTSEPPEVVNNYNTFSLGDAARSLIPGLGMLRTGADHAQGLRDMIRHAQKSTKHASCLPEFLTRAPNTVKRAFTKVLDKNPRLLKHAVDQYGEDALVAALRDTKTAGMSNTGGALLVADKGTDAKAYSDFFGEAAPEAFTGVLTRGYYFKDTRKSLNLAAQVQEYHDFQDTLDSGVYNLYTEEGAPKAALVFVEPFDLLSADRFTFPRDENRVKPIKSRVPVDAHRREPHNLGPIERDLPDAPDVERSHKYSRMAILGNGDYVLTHKLFGEKTTESLLKGTALYSAILTEKKAQVSRGVGCFVAKRGASYLGTLPVEVTEMTTGSDGVIRGKLGAVGGWDVQSFVIDPKANLNRPMKLRDQRLVLIPASWKWVSLKDSKEDSDFLRTADALHRMVLNTLKNDGVKEAAVKNAGHNMFAVDGERALGKKDALVKIAQKYHVHASAAEAMLKIASHEGVCRAYVMSPTRYQALTERVKIAQGQAVPQTPMGAPPAMQQAPQMPMQAAPAPMPQEPAAPPAPSPVDQAFGESMGMLQQQMQQLQAQLDVLMMVQQRAQQIESGEAGQMDPSQSMQGMPQGMDPSMGMDPAAMGGQMDPSMMGMDPAAQQQPPMPIMNTEEPSADEIAQQINPAFLENAAQLHETGAFDAGTMASLAQNSTLKSITSQFAANFESSIDDLGRSLLTLYMQEPQLKEQLGDQTFIDLETQLRDTFHGLGKLVLSMTHNATMLDPNAVA